MVKTILKRNNVLLSQFASDLHISRPTLDTYIKNYDNGIELTNNLYQKIFDFLFAELTVSNEDFAKKYEYILANYGKSGEIKSGMSTLTGTVLENMVNDGSIKRLLSDDELNSLGDLVNNKDLLLYQLVKMKLVLSNKIELDSLNDKEKMITVGMYELSLKLANSDYSYNVDSYDQLQQAINRKKNTISNEEMKKIIVDKISEMVESAVNSGDTETLNKLLKSLSNGN